MRIRRHLIGTAAAGLAAFWGIRHFAARAVRKWRPGRGRFVRAGKLIVRVAGAGDRAFILFHGLVSSGETFGSAYDRLAEHGKLIIPDLLGFGRSMNADVKGFCLVDHLDALDQMMDALGLSKTRIVLGGHSLGALIALHWAARRAEQIDAIVVWGPPLFRDEAEARRQLKAMGPLEALFAHDSAFAAKACALMCAYRRFARLLAIALSPDLPIAVSSRAILHTWPAYRGALTVFFSDWRSALRRLEKEGVPVTLVAGARDRSQVEGLTDSLAARFRGVRNVIVNGAAHILPITHPDLCVAQMIQSSPES